MSLISSKIARPHRLYPNDKGRQSHFKCQELLHTVKRTRRASRREALNGCGPGARLSTPGGGSPGSSRVLCIFKVSGARSWQTFLLITLAAFQIQTVDINVYDNYASHNYLFL